MHNYSVDEDKAGLLLIDVQEKLLPTIDHPEKVLDAIKKMIRGFRILELPILVTEQYPQGLGPTIEPLRRVLPEEQLYLPKTSFSAMGDNEIKYHTLLRLCHPLRYNLRTRLHVGITFT